MSESQITYFDLADGRPLRLTPLPTVITSSAKVGWYGIAVEQWRLPAMELPENIATQHLLTIRLSAASTLEWKTGAHFESAVLAPNAVCLSPAHLPRQLRWQEEIELLAVALDPMLVARIAQESGRAAPVELIETHGIYDPQVLYIGLAIRSELETGCLGGRLYVEALTTALAAHLLGHYNAFPSVGERVYGGLPPTKLRRAIEYIQDNLDTDLSLPEIATTLDMSLTRFKSQFKQSTGLAPHQYVIQQRVERARQLLLRSDVTPAQAAVRVGFYDQSHLTRHFKRLLGITPKSLLDRK